MLNKILTFFGFYLILFFTLSQLSFGQGTSNIEGQITDKSTNDGLPGANIILAGTNRGASSDRYGNFIIHNVPAGSYTLKVSYIGYSDFVKKIDVSGTKKTITVNAKLVLSAIKINEIVVNGLLQGQVKALNQQMNSDKITNVLSHEEMQKFPDMNTADVLQRIPGININRSLGEGSFVFIRGTEPRLTEVTVNGQTLPSSQDQYRYVDLGVINSSQLASVQVIKALTPDMDADAIGGTVNLITKSPFDVQKPTLNIDAAGGYAYQANLPLYRFSANYTGFAGKGDHFGYTINGSYYRDNIRTYSDQMEWDNVTDVNGKTIPFAMTDLSFYDYNTTRDHYGLSTNLEYRMNNNNRFYIRGMFNRMNDNQSRNMVENAISKGNYLNATTIAKTKLDFEFQNRDEIHQIATASAGGKNLIGNANLDYDFTFGWAQQTHEDPGQIKSDWQLTEKPNLFLNLDNVNFPVVNYTNITQSFAQDPANWGIDKQDYRSNVTLNYTYTGTVNLQIPYSLGILPGNIKAGLKFNLDRKTRSASRIQYKWKGSNNVLMSTVASGNVIDNFLLGNYSFGPEINNGLVRAFFNQYAGLNNGLRPYIDYLDSDGEGGNYDTRENIYAAYVMSTLNIGNLFALAGVRDEYTHSNYQGTEIFVDNSGNFLNALPIDNLRNFNNFFPYLQLRYQVSPKTNLRFAVTRGIARPNYFDLAPYNWVDPSSDQITRGNPDLLPTISTNIDLMLGHYFQGIGVASIGLFYKNMDEVIYSRTYKQVGGPYDGFDIAEPVNGGNAKLIGVELNWMQQFSFLPGFLSGFGIYGNYTYTKSKADLQYRNWTALPGQAGDVGNLGLSFERYGVTARLSLNYNAKILQEVGISPDYDRYTDKHYELDFAGTYEINRNLSVYVNAINLTNAPYREYQGITTRPRDNEYYGRSIRTGIKYKL